MVLGGSLGIGRRLHQFSVWLLGCSEGLLGGW